MALLLRGESQIIWIASSGGRDRPDPLTGKWHPASFDESSVDNMRRLVDHSGVMGHMYPLALLCYGVMPPRPEVEKQIGERRKFSFHGVGLSVAPEINFDDIASGCENPEEIAIYIKLPDHAWMHIVVRLPAEEVPSPFGSSNNKIH
ncbi:glycerol-3-phosphate acyltransferase, partial [Musa troglodytarum]